MLRGFVLLLGLASSGCVLGDGIDLPSMHGEPTDGGLTGSEGADGSDTGQDTGAPPVLAPSGSGGNGGSPCCSNQNLGGLSGAESGGAAP